MTKSRGSCVKLMAFKGRGTHTLSGGQVVTWFSCLLDPIEAVCLDSPLGWASLHSAAQFIVGAQVCVLESQL